MNHAVGFLNDEALLAVSAYYASLAPVGPAEVEAVAADAARAGGGDAFADIRDDMKKCIKCHGEDGNATGSGMPNLTAQDPAYFTHSMQAYRTG
jgi:cytochrome c553